MNINAIGYTVYDYYKNANRAKNADSSVASAEQLLLNKSSPKIPSMATKNTETVTNAVPHFNVIIPKGDIINSRYHPDGSYDTFKYAENSTKENPLIVVNSVDKNGNESERTIKLKEIDLNNATSTEIMALETHVTVSSGGKAGLSKLAPLYHIMDMNNQKDVPRLMNKMIDHFMTSKQLDTAKEYADKLRLFINFLS